MKSKLLLALLAGMLAATTAFADDQTGKGAAACPENFQAAIDTEFGDGTSAITTCIAKHEDLKEVLNMSTPVLNPKKPISQTLNNAELMLQNYQNVYGITIGDGLKLNIVAHFQGGQFLLSDEAYDKLKYATVPGYAGGGNPSRATVEDLLAKGVHIYMCQNTMRGNGWKTPDLIAGVEQVPGGVVALADFAQRGWAVITP